MTEENKETLAQTETTETPVQPDGSVDQTVDTMSDAEQIQAERNAEAHLKAVQATHDVASEQTRLAGVTRSEFNQLTAKNQQFMMTLDRRLVEELHYEVRTKVYQEMVETLLEGQQTGQTARQLYGTPTEVADNILEQNLTPDKEEGERSPDWQLFMDGALLLGSVFTILTGFSMVRNAANTQYFGVLTMIINYLAAGLAMLITAKNLPNPDGPKGKKGYPRYFLASIGSMAVWFLAVSFSGALLPKVINPILGGQIYVVIGVTTFLLRIYLKRQLNIRGGIF